ncbi:hypothetical protein ACLOJK_025205 [Asimina triloba]
MSGDSSDDDFQNPSQAISLTQTIIFSSIQSTTSQDSKHSSSVRLRKPKSGSSGRKENTKIPRSPKSRVLDSRISAVLGANSHAPADFHSSQPLRPRNAAGPPKKLKPSVSFGKENCPVSGTLEDHVVESRISIEPTKEMEIGRGTDPVLSLDESGALESGTNGAPLMKLELGNQLGMEDREVMRKPNIDRGVSEVCNGLEGVKEKSGYYSNSMESRLLGPKPENARLQEDGLGDFEPGTQLNELMNLCLEACKEENSDVGVYAEGDISVDNSVMGVSVQCPLCGADISDLSEESRQLHTNACLDRDELIIQNEDTVLDSPQQQVVDVSPVLEWLRNLGLSKYEEAFIKEEIDWETLQWISEEDLVGMGITALGPRKKIVHALDEIKRNMHGHESNTHAVKTINTENKNPCLPGNKLITEFFQGPAVHRNINSGPPVVQQRLERSTADSGRKRATPGSRIRGGRLRDIPPWCCIPGTPFRVGLTRGFCHGIIYCSSITAHLVNMKIGIPWDRLKILPLGQKVSIEGINVTSFDANHCPGSIIILFEPPNNKAVLHTGDFRFSENMTNISLLQSSPIHTLILDTTYCNPQYDFPKQDTVIQFVVDAIQAEAFNPKTLFLIGSYTIGKERLFLEVARCLHKKIYVGAAKLQLLQCLELPKEDMDWLTLNEHESHIHVVPMWMIASFKRMKHISDRYTGNFDLIVAFSPTGWSFGKGKKKSPGRRYEVPYSEHCSFTELREFVKFISPANIIPSVNNDGPETADAMVALLMSES